jgi:hypothetical protein
LLDIPRLYIPACSNSVQLIVFHSVIISILCFTRLKVLVKKAAAAVEAARAIPQQKILPRGLQSRKYSQTRLIQAEDVTS